MANLVPSLEFLAPDSSLAGAVTFGRSLKRHPTRENEMKLPKLLLAVAAMALAAVAGTANAEYPERPVEFVVHGRRAT